MSQTKSMSDERSESLRVYLERLVKRDFRNDQTRAAARIGVAQSTISAVLSKGRGMGAGLMEALLKYDAAGFLAAFLAPDAPRVADDEEETLERDAADVGHRVAPVRLRTRSTSKKA